MNWKICQIGSDPTVAFAAEELYGYLKKMDSSAHFMRTKVQEFTGELPGTLYVGCAPAYAEQLPRVEDPERDDGILIRVKNGAGIITGTNFRSVLLAAYRYLKELGCAFLHPGKGGELVPAGHPEKTAVSVCEAPSYRHRAVCIEGAVSYEHVADMIDWLPKNGMNGYFIQFRKPYEFFDRWYSHENNELLPPEPLTAEELDGVCERLKEEIRKRGLVYHAVGHSWTCEPFGVGGDGWNHRISEIPDSVAPYLAQVRGKRDWWGGVPLNTNLCYSNPIVRATMVNSIVAYCAEHPEVSYLHFWLADGANNHCECENCKELPADYYVMMLNELDEKLTARKIDTRIVFLIYVDLLWEPKKERIRNPDRFLLMFAPITRTYSSSFSVLDAEVAEADKKLDPYEKNQLTMPKSVADNVARLRRWQEQFSGDSFDFDYHFMWDHFCDPGYTECARLIGEDMKNLRNLGLNGMNSCQLQRVFFPTSLPMLTMAETLWNREASFKNIAKKYFTQAFGADGIKVWHYLTAITKHFDPVYLRGEKPVLDMAKARTFADVQNLIDSFMSIIIRNISRSDLPEAVITSWKYLLYHAQACSLFAEACAYRAEGNQAEAAAKYHALTSYFCRIEPEIHSVFDLCLFRRTMDKRFAD